MLTEPEPMDQGYFQGRERLAFFGPLARLMRHGTPDDLEVPDRERILDALKAGDSANATAYLQLASLLHLQLTFILFEWAIEWPNTLAKLRTTEDERSCTERAFQSWQAACDTIATNSDSGAAVEAVSKILAPALLKPGVSDAFRVAVSNGGNGAADPWVQLHMSKRDAVAAAIERQDFHEAERLTESYWRFAVGLHDALVQYCQTYPATASRLFGQVSAERLIHDSFSSASFFEGLWALGYLAPKDLAAFLAEHLRAHFSGRQRGSSVRIVEHPERYQLIFDSCGSGQEMRRRACRAGSLAEVFAEPTPATWNRAAEVPVYCAHCAFNEIESIRRFGYPVLVTEFDPDPEKPCGWTVYKDPRLIPDRYFERLGMKKDTGRFSTLAE